MERKQRKYHPGSFESALASVQAEIRENLYRNQLKMIVLFSHAKGITWKYEVIQSNGYYVLHINSKWKKRFCDLLNGVGGNVN